MILQCSDQRFRQLNSKKLNCLILVAIQFPKRHFVTTRESYIDMLWSAIICIADSKSTCFCDYHPANDNNLFTTIALLLWFQNNPKTHEKTKGIWWLSKYIQQCHTKVFRKQWNKTEYMSHSQMLGKFEYTLPAKFWRLVGCTEMLSW